MKCAFPKMKFTYNGYYGSCQTFCTRIFDVQKLTDLNLEANFSSTNAMKTFFGKFVNCRNRGLDLIRKMDQRLTHGSTRGKNKYNTVLSKAKHLAKKVKKYKNLGKTDKYPKTKDQILTGSTFEYNLLYKTIVDHVLLVLTYMGLICFILDYFC